MGIEADRRIERWSEVVNLGRAAALSGVTFGTGSTFNTVVGVTSWDTDAIKEQGAGPFTFNKISVLVNLACTAYPANCKQLSSVWSEVEVEERIR